MDGQLAGAYISSTEWARFDPYLQIVYEVTMIHEVFHLMGAVAPCAPNQGRGAHVVDHDLDIMSNSSAPHWEWTYIDYGNDDYYGHGRSDCVDISTSPYFTGVLRAGNDKVCGIYGRCRQLTTGPRGRSRSPKSGSRFPPA